MGPKVPNHPLHLNTSLDLTLRPLRMRRVRRPLQSPPCSIIVTTSNFCRCSQPMGSHKPTFHLPMRAPHLVQVLDLTTTWDRLFTTLPAHLLRVNTLPLVVGHLWDTATVAQHSCALLSLLSSPNQSRQVVSTNLTIHSGAFCSDHNRHVPPVPPGPPFPVHVLTTYLRPLLASCTLVYQLFYD